MILVLYNPFWTCGCSRQNRLRSLNFLRLVFLKPSQTLLVFTNIKSNTTFPSPTCLCVTREVEPEHGGSPHHFSYLPGAETPCRTPKRTHDGVWSQWQSWSFHHWVCNLCLGSILLSPTLLKGLQHDPKTPWAWCSALYPHTKPSSSAKANRTEFTHSEEGEDSFSLK